MAARKYLTIANNRTTEVSPITASAGATSAGEIPALGPAGTFDPTLMPPGLAVLVAQMTASEAIAAGAYVNVWSNAGVFSVRNADGSVTGKQVDGFVLQAIAAGATGQVYFGGMNTAVTGQAPGLVFLSASTLGAGSPNGATGAGQTFQQIGIALSATAVLVDPQEPITRA